MQKILPEFVCPERKRLQEFQSILKTYLDILIKRLYTETTGRVAHSIHVNIFSMAAIPLQHEKVRL